MEVELTRHNLLQRGVTPRTSILILCDNRDDTDPCCAVDSSAPEEKGGSR